MINKYSNFSLAYNNQSSFAEKFHFFSKNKYIKTLLMLLRCAFIERLEKFKNYLKNSWNILFKTYFITI